MVPCDEKGRAMPCGMRAGGSSLQVRAQIIRYALNYLESVVGRRIVDETGLTDTFELTLEWSRGAASAALHSIERGVVAP
jgi:uncharacterized protein (TIGR03435 family)